MIVHYDGDSTLARRLMCIFFSPLVRNLKPLLTVSFISGDISLMNNYDDLAPTVIRSGLKGNDLFNVYVWADQMCCD